MQREYWSGFHIRSLAANEVLVFGSNPEGRHGLGVALLAQRFGAVYGKGYGLHGQTYAIVTKNLTPGYMCPVKNVLFNRAGWRSVDPPFIIEQIKELYAYAVTVPDIRFLISYKKEYYHNGKIKRSLNGYDGNEMRKMFFAVEPPLNIIFHESFK